MSLDIEKYAVDYHFASTIHRAKEPQFLSTVKPVFDEYVQKIKNNSPPQSPVYPAILTELISTDERLHEFVQYVSNISWDVLNSQGYNMDLFYTNTSEIYGQHHPYMSSMEQHIHGLDVQLCGFYFIDTPPYSSSLIIHDPRSAKVYAWLQERKADSITSAHNMIYYTPVPGDLIFTNPWLAHSFTRNQSQHPYNFIHINVRVEYREDRITIKNNTQPSGPIII